MRWGFPNILGAVGHGGNTQWTTRKEGGGLMSMMAEPLSPRKINGWKLRIRALEKENHLNQTIIFRFYVNLPGCVKKIWPDTFVNEILVVE